MVERADALDRPVGEPLRQMPIALVEPARSRRKGAVGVSVVLEDAQERLERRAPGGRDHGSPRMNATSGSQIASFPRDPPRKTPTIRGSASAFASSSSKVIA